jgi:hypothetical protein
MGGTAQRTVTESTLTVAASRARIDRFLGQTDKAASTSDGPPSNDDD